jgi:hypothetical protein
MQRAGWPRHDVATALRCRDHVIGVGVVAGRPSAVRPGRARVGAIVVGAGVVRLSRVLRQVRELSDRAVVSRRGVVGGSRQVRTSAVVCR